MTYALIQRTGTQIDILAVEPDQEQAESLAQRFRAEGRIVSVQAVANTSPVQAIHSPEDLLAFARQYGLRDDWHEPDEQGIDIRLIGTHLDNAMGSTMRPCPSDDPTNPSGEFNIVITHREDEQDAPRRDVAVLNVATLLSWVTSYVREIETRALVDGL